VSEHDEREDYDDEPWKRRADVAALVHWPALLLGTFATIQLAFSVVGCIWLPGALVWNWIDPEFFNNDGPQWPEVVLGILACTVCASLNGLILVGARRLAKFQNFRLVLWAISVSFLSLPIIYCALVMVPISIWALVVVLNRDVRVRFEAVARGTMGQTPEVEKSGGSELPDPNRGDRPD
jgi:hypothetical protein